MAAISSSVGMQAATQAAFQQLKLRQARQDAERAEQVARSLQLEASDAEREAVRAEENARSLSAQSKQAQGVAGRARQGLAMIRSVSEMQDSFSNLRVPASEAADASPRTSATAATESVPVVNTSGQMTGVVVNTTA